VLAEYYAGKVTARVAPEGTAVVRGKIRNI